MQLKEDKGRKKKSRAKGRRNKRRKKIFISIMFGNRRGKRKEKCMFFTFVVPHKFEIGMNFMPKNVIFES